MNLPKLNERVSNLMDETGMSLAFISKKTGIKSDSLRNKLNGETEFKVSEMTSLSEFLKLTTKEKVDIFFN